MNVEEKELERRIALIHAEANAAHKHKWTTITKGAGIGGRVCAECFAMTDTPAVAAARYVRRLTPDGCL